MIRQRVTGTFFQLTFQFDTPSREWHSPLSFGRLVLCNISVPRVPFGTSFSTGLICIISSSPDMGQRERREQLILHGARMIPPCDSTALMTQATRMLACGGAWGSKDGHFRRKWWDHSLDTGQPLRRSAPASATSIVALGLTAHCSFRLIPPLRCIPHSGRSAPSPFIRGCRSALPFRPAGLMQFLRPPTRGKENVGNNPSPMERG